MPDTRSNAVDLLVPSFDSPSRQSTVGVAVLNLMATIVGGGVLSLPWAFGRLGIGTATILMILAAYATEQSLYLLCLTARLTGASSYGEIGRMAFGPATEGFLAVLLGVFLLFVIVAYQVLLRDIWTPLVVSLLGYDQTDGEHHVSGNVVMACLLVLLGPFLVQHNLHALRYNCFVGFVSVSILCAALCHHAFWGKWPTQYGTASTSPLYFTDQPSDLLLAFPIIALSFLSHFNILPLQAALVQPTRARIRRVIRLAVAGCGLLMYLFGLGGYVYAGAATEGNVLLNLSSNTMHPGDPFFVVGRMGVGVTIMVATPIMTLPCRENLLEVVEMLMGQEDQVEMTVIGEQTALLRDEPIQKDPLLLSPFWHYGSTLLIVMITYGAAVAVPGVAVVWSLCGSSMAFLIAFILPAAYFVRVTQQEHAVEYHRPRIIFCWILLAISVLAAVACTAQTVGQMIFGA